MRPIILWATAILMVCSISTASSQETSFERPQQEHRLIERFAGAWNFERYSVPADGSDPEALGRGTIAAEMVGEFFVVSRWSGNVYGLDYKAFQSLGYDATSGKYTGAWVDSLISFRWELTGTWNEATREFTLTTSGPAPTGGITAFRERYQFNSPDAITIVGEMQHGEGWMALTTTRLTRLPSNPSTLTK